MADEQTTIDIGAHRELFVDDFLIDKMTGTSLRQQLPKDEGTVLKFDAPGRAHSVRI